MSRWICFTVGVILVVCVVTELQKSADLMEDKSVWIGPQHVQHHGDSDTDTEFGVLLSSTPNRRRLGAYVQNSHPETHDRSKRAVNFVGEDDNRYVNLGEIPLQAPQTEENSAERHSSVTHSVESNIGLETENSEEATNIKDVFLSVKSTETYHNTRLPVLLDTWMSVVPQAYIFTDAPDERISKRTHDHLVNTNCSSSHHRTALCCKMSVELDYYYASDKRWFCHVDDDTYVNIPALVTLLQQYDHTRDWYLGRSSIGHPVKIPHPEFRGKPGSNQEISFWFATGGGGFCISRALALKMMPYAGGGKLRTACDQIRLPDDVTIGFVISYYLNKELTIINKFHSHLEGLLLINEAKIRESITLSYGERRNKPNVVSIRDGLDAESDPTRFYSIHCLIYNIEKCQQNWR